MTAIFFLKILNEVEQRRADRIAVMKLKSKIKLCDVSENFFEKYFCNLKYSFYSIVFLSFFL